MSSLELYSLIRDDKENVPKKWNWEGSEDGTK